MNWLLKQKSRIYWGIFLILSINQCCIAQDNSPSKAIEKITSAPEVSSLGKFGSTSVNRYAGLANINIPIFSIPFDGLTIPLTLSYNSGGIRTSQESTWIGLGWNLSSNPVIHRTINGFDDLKSHSINAGFIYQNREAQDPEGTSEAYLTQEDATQIYNSYIPGSFPLDLEPDIFEVNLFGESYKFRLRKISSGNSIITALALNNKNVRITYDVIAQNFEIVDQKGFHYYFNSKEYSSTFTSENSNWSLTPGGTVSDQGALDNIRDNCHINAGNVITAWLLDRVESPLGKELFFNYQPAVQFSYPSYSGSISIQEKEIYSNTYNEGQGSNGSGATEIVSASTTGMDTFYLTSITGDFGTINFELSPREDLFNVQAFKNLRNISGNFTFYTPERNYSSDDPVTTSRLTGIQVFNKNSELVKDISFFQSYFDKQFLTSSNPTTFLRLKLDSLEINDQKYSFAYEQPDNLPGKDTKDVDFWGFYNGAGNTGRVPSYNRFFYSSVNGHTSPITYDDLNEIYIRHIGASKRSNFNFGKIGILKKIIYPTGGSSEFTYEPNDALISVPQPYMVKEYYPDGQIKRTNLNSEEAYGFSYQYLKLANDTTYDYFEHSVDTSGVNVQVPLGVDDTFSVSTTSILTCSATFACYTGCENTSYYSSYPIRTIQDVNDYSKEYTLFTYGDASTGSKSISLVLPPGDYQIKYRSAPYIPGEPGIPAIGIVEEQTGDQKPYILNTSDSGGIYAGSLVEKFEIGGARIGSIVNYDVNQVFASKKIYEYELPEADPSFASSGILMDDLIYHSKNSGYYSYTPEEFESYLTFTSNSTLRSTASASGSHLGYSYVTEKSLDIEGHDLGRTDYKYSNNPNQYFTESFCRTIYNPNNTAGHNPPEVCYTSMLIGLAPKNEYSYSNGNLLTKNVFNSSGELLSKTQNTYSIYTGLGDDMTQVRMMPLYPYSDYYLNNRFYYTYKLPTYYSLSSELTQSLDTEFFDGKEITTSTNFSYDADTHLLVYKEIGTSDGGFLSYNFIYPYELIGEPQVSALLSLNRISTPLMKETFKNGIKINSEKTVYANDISTGNLVLPKTLYSKKGSGTIDNLSKENKMYTYTKYDNFGNPEELTRIDGTSICYIWGYAHQYPIAKIENATYTQVASALGVSTTTLDSYDESNLSAINLLRSNVSLNGALVTTYTYIPLVGVSTITDPKGMVTSYTYDSFNRLQYIKDQNGKLLKEYTYHYKGQ